LGPRGGGGGGQAGGGAGGGGQINPTTSYAANPGVVILTFSR
jgi:hypothetical protein